MYFINSSLQKNTIYVVFKCRIMQSLLRNQSRVAGGETTESTFATYLHTRLFSKVY